MSSDNFQVRLKSILYADLDIIGIAETHFTEHNVIKLPGYTWFGQNRKELHRNARKGSGGIGFLINQRFTQCFNVSVLDVTTEGIMWLKPKSKLDIRCIIMCVCYLPPENSTRRFQQKISWIKCYVNPANIVMIVMFCTSVEILTLVAVINLILLKGWIMLKIVKYWITLKTNMVRYSVTS